MEYFVGMHERQLDPKGRLALPASYRPRFEPSCYCVLGSANCIGVLTPAESQAVVSKMIAAVEAGERSSTELRAMAANMIEVPVDKQGRILLDERLRSYAGLELNSRVIVAGAFTRLEIWEPSAFEAMQQAGQSKIAAGSL